MFFPVPKRTASCLAFSVLLNKSGRSFDMEAYVMAPWGHRAIPSFFVLARAAASTFSHAEVRPPSYLRGCPLAERCTYLVCQHPSGILRSGHNKHMHYWESTQCAHIVNLKPQNIALDSWQLWVSNVRPDTLTSLFWQISVFFLRNLSISFCLARCSNVIKPTVRTYNRQQE